MEQSGTDSVTVYYRANSTGNKFGCTHGARECVIINVNTPEHAQRSDDSVRTILVWCELQWATANRVVLEQ
jgi:hypothetical protein